MSTTDSSYDHVGNFSKLFVVKYVGENHFEDLSTDGENNNKTNIKESVSNCGLNSDGLGKVPV